MTAILEPTTLTPAVEPIPANRARERDREVSAARLMKASADHSYDPETEVDWLAPPVPGLLYCPETQCSLYGTALWDGMTPEQRIDASKHQVASLAAVGIWFEIILMQMLIRRSYDQKPTTDHMRYGLVEIADECRHSIMFGRMIEKMECPDYGPAWLAKVGGRFIKTFADGAVTYAGALIAEEILDSFQREAMNDGSVQPLVQTVSRIHVVEEARHVRYAKEELRRIWPTLPWYRKAWNRVLIAGAAVVITDQLIHRDLYANLGLDGHEARKAAALNPNWQAAKARSARKLVAFFDELGIINRATRWRWRRAGLLGATEVVASS